MDDATRELLAAQADDIRQAGLWKSERLLTSRQGALVTVGEGAQRREVLNFCANNYLGLSSDPRVVAAAHAGLDERGFGMSSVRFICGTQDRHKELEGSLARFFGFEDCVLYGSCYDANGGLFETLLTAEDAVISDALNHASIIDGVRLCKAQRYRYASGDMTELEARLREASGARIRLIATDGVFSMDGTLAPLDRICDLAARYGALVMVDDSHASGFVGPTGRGTPEHFGVQGRVDILTSTLGKALGGASGGFTAASTVVTDLLRQRSRPYLFSNSLAPSIVAAGLAALRILSTMLELRERLMTNARRFREGMTEVGFTIKPGDHPIVPVMLGDARLASAMADDLLVDGIYVIGFSYPVVPRGEARIRVQLSAAHEPDQVERAIAAFAEVGARHGALDR
ncbi:MAG TPA: glycine C-acetyltransferase [Thermoleophilia bacterium]|nr:glycine C-acetyltransferase [Thermoleophilia bacterium]